MADASQTTSYLVVPQVQTRAFSRLSCATTGAEVVFFFAAIVALGGGVGAGVRWATLSG